MPSEQREIDIAKFMAAIRGNESGGSYDVYNVSGSGCAGGYQFSQDTWDAYAAIAAPAYVGIDPAQAPPEVQDAVMHEKCERMYEKYGGDFRLMAVEHYGGEGAANAALTNGYIPDTPEYYNGDEYPSQLAYANDIVARMGSPLPGIGGLSAALKHSRGVYQPNASFPIIINPEVYQVNRDDRPFLDKLGDTFQNMWYENGTIAAIRTALIKSGNRSLKSDAGWSPTESDLALMDELLGDNQVAKNSVLLNSDNAAQFKAFLQTKKEDLDREKRAEQTSFGLHSVLGGLAGMLLDPINLIPFVGQEALVAKVGARLGSKVLADIGAKRIYQIAETGLAQGMVNMADSYLSQRYGIHEANYAVSGVLGAAGGAAARILRTVKHAGVNTNGPNMKSFEAQANANQTQAVRDAMDMGDAVSLSTHVELRKSTEAEQELSKLLGLTDTSSLKRSKQVKKAMDMSIRSLLTSVSDVESLVGKKSSQLLRRAGLPKDASLTDLLRVTRENPDISRQVKKAAEKYRKRTFSTDVWEGFRQSLLKDKDPAVNLSQYAMEALMDTVKANTLRLQIEKNTGRKMSNREVQETLKKILYRETGVSYTDDGTIISNGVRIRPESPIHNAIVHPETFDPSMKDIDMEMTEPIPGSTVYSASISPEDLQKQNSAWVSDEAKKAFAQEPEFGVKSKKETREETQISFASKIGKYLGQKMQDTKFLGNTYGHFTNSVSNHLRSFGHKFLADARGNPGRKAEGMELPLETVKSILYRDLNTLIKQVAIHYPSFYTKVGGMPKTAKRKFGLSLQKAYDAKMRGLSIDSYPKEIQDGVKAIEEFRKTLNVMNKQAGLIDEAIEDTGFYRRADIDKVSELLLHFDNQDDAVEWLTDYCVEAADRSALEKRWKADLAKRQADIDKRLKEGKKVSEAEEEALATETLDDYILREAHKCAKGTLDRNLSATRTEMYDINRMSKMEEYQRRFPMNTSHVYSKELPNGGGVWTYDDCLREWDAVRIMHDVANRSAARITMASHGVTDMGAYFNKQRDVIYRELRVAAENKRLINRKEIKDQLDEYDYIVSKFTGYRYGAMQYEDPMNDLARFLTKISYAANGMNMGTNQISEAAGGVGVVGVRAMTHLLPGLHKWLYGLRHTALSYEQMKKLAVASEYCHYNFFNPMDLTTPKMDRIGVRAKIVGAANDAADYAADITSAINQLGQMTENSIAGLEMDVMSDVMDWCLLGKKTHLFDSYYLKEAGIRDVDKFQSVIRKWFGNLDENDPDAVVKAMVGMRDKDYQTYLSLRAFTQQTAQRAILQPTLGNDNYFAKRGAWPIFFQFKNFSRMALDSHLGRFLEKPDKEKWGIFMSSAIAGGAIWAVRTQVYANWKYKDEKERQKYLDETLTPANFVRAGFTRASTTAGLSYANDAYEMFSGAPTVRTTVSRRSTDDSLGARVDQLPAVGTANDLLFGVGGSAWGSIHDLITDNRIYQDDAKTMTTLFPIDKFVGTQAILSGVLDMHQGDFVSENFQKRPTNVPTRNPVQILQKAITGTNEVEENEKKRKESQKKRRDKDKPIIEMKGKW